MSAQMAEGSKWIRSLRNGELTFGLREAIILAVVACAIATAVVYLNVL
jgi:hypothetical protein